MKCRFCDKLMTGRKRKFCDALCCRRERDKRRREKYAAGRQQGQCEHCGEPVLSFVKSGRMRRWCSDRCRCLLTVVNKYARNCRHCDEPFTTPNVTTVYCSLVCAQAARPRIEKACVVCGERFASVVEFASKNQCCSMKCCNKRSKKLRRLYVHALQRRRQDVVDAGERIDPYAVFERDGWVCQICGEPVPRDAVRPDPLSASIDHHIPITKDGAHTMANVRLAHLGCNARKSNKVEPAQSFQCDDKGQLLLFA